MSTLSTIHHGAGLLAWCGSLKGLLRGKRKVLEQADADEEQRSYDACLRDLVLSHPHAFANEMDVQYLLTMYPSSR